MLRKGLIGFTAIVLATASPLTLMLPSQLDINVTDSPTANNSWTSGFPHLGTRKLDCKGDVYGHNLQYTSCANVVQVQMVDPGLQTFAPRGVPGQVTYNTPWRWSSCKSERVYHACGVEATTDV